MMKVKTVPRAKVLIMGGIVITWMLSACGNHVYHRVEHGDSLYSIGWQYNHDYRQVAAWNNLKSPYVLAPGQWLRVAPPMGERVPPESRSSGDTLSSIDSPSWKLPPTVNKSKMATQTVVPTVTSANPAPSPTATKPPSRIAPQTWRWPTRGELVRTFVAVDPRKKGVDIRGRLGQPIWSAAPGRVVYGGNGLAAYGNLLIIKHDDNYLTAYAHNRKLHVQEGDSVTAGQHIADMGKSGTEEVMLHFEIRYQGKPVDPLRYLPAVKP